jgi:exosortase A-associated hydrolase 1
MSAPTPPLWERVLTFDCQSSQLIGILHEPAATRPTDVGVLVIVGGPQYRVGSHRQFVLLARAVARAGYPVLRFDYRGMGDSDGGPGKFDAIEADVRSAVDAFLAARPELTGVVLWALCDGASAALMYCNRDRRVQALALANPWVYTQTAEAKSYIRHYYFGRLLQRSFWTKLLRLKVSLRASLSDFLQKLLAFRGAARSEAGEGFIQRMLAGLRAFEGPVLFMLSERDLTARQFQDLIEGDDAWRQATNRTSVSVRALPGADHTFSSRDALDAATRTCIAWLGEALGDRRAQVALGVDRVANAGSRQGRGELRVGSSAER